MGHCASVSPFIKWGEITQTCLFCWVLYMNPLKHQLKSRKYFHRDEGWVELDGLLLSCPLAPWPHPASSSLYLPTESYSLPPSRGLGAGRVGVRGLDPSVSGQSKCPRQGLAGLQCIQWVIQTKQASHPPIQGPKAF